MRVRLENPKLSLFDTRHYSMTPVGRATRWLEALAGDMRFALRYFARHKATTALIVAVLALGTGANALTFSFFQAQFLRPPPAVSADDAQVRIWAQERATRTASWQPRLFSQPELAALAERRDVFEEVTGWAEDEVVLRGDSTGARAVGAQFVMPNFFGLLRVPLAAGRSFLPHTGDSPDLTAVMSHLVAGQLYGNAGAAIGRRILVNEIPVQVIGVAPPRFQGALRNMDEPGLWMPLSARTEITRLPPRWLTDRAALEPFARLAPGASREQATALARQAVAHALPDSAARIGMARTADVFGMHQLPPGDAAREAVIAFTVIISISMIILLVGWTNVSSLMVAAAVARRHEIAVRLSLGASRHRLLRQLVTESTILALVAGLVGLLMAWWMLVYNAKTEIDGVDIVPDLGTFAFVLALAVAAGILFGLSPALHATRGAVSLASKSRSPRQ